MVTVHLMVPAAREYYALEELWQPTGANSADPTSALYAATLGRGGAAGDATAEAEAVAAAMLAAAEHPRATE